MLYPYILLNVVLTPSKTDEYFPIIPHIPSRWPILNFEHRSSQNKSAYNSYIVHVVYSIDLLLAYVLL